MSGVVEAIAFKTTRYKCPFCSRSYSRRTPANRHIDRCWNNPEVQGCKTCIWHIVHDPEPDVGLPGDEFCNAADHHDLTDGLRVNCPSYAPTNPNETDENLDQEQAVQVELDIDNTDATHWAGVFMESFSGSVVGAETVDESLMIAWFANAIETGRRNPDPPADLDPTQGEHQ